MNIVNINSNIELGYIIFERRLKGRWRGMLSRCYGKNHDSYRLYGGRGIIVCDEWLIYDNFRYWFLQQDKNKVKGYSVDRIDNDGNYEPSNCKLSDPIEQSINCRNVLNSKRSIKKINGDRFQVYGRGKCLCVFDTYEKALEVKMNSYKKNV